MAWLARYTSVMGSRGSGASWRAAFAGTAVLLIPAEAPAQDWTFARIADTETYIPGTTSAFEQFGVPSLRADGTVAFTGRRTSTPTAAGAYLGAGAGLTVLADHTTPIPEGTGTFLDFAHTSALYPVSYADASAFVGDGFGTQYIQRGVYVREGATIRRVVDRQVAIPGGAGSLFFHFNQPTIVGGRVVFAASDYERARSGVYSWQNGVLSILVDNSTSLPGWSGSIEQYYRAKQSGNEIVFSAMEGGGFGDYRGVFKINASGAVARLYDTLVTVVPGGNGGIFEHLGATGFDAGHVVLYGGGGGQEGIYADIGGTLSVVADHGTEIPGRPGRYFTSFGHSSISGDIVAFDSGGQGVYSTHGGVLGKVVAFGDVVNGRTVSSVWTGYDALQGDSIALWMSFTDGTTGIYRAVIPAPGGASTIGLLGCALASRRRRRQLR